MTTQIKLLSQLKDQTVNWHKASQVAASQAINTGPTRQTLDRAELLWGKTDLSAKFRELLNKRGLSIYDRTLEHHFTGSAILLDPKTRRILMTFHPWYKMWQQLGGHDDGENNPLAISAKEAWEESGIDDLWICDWPVRIDPHPAEKCKSVKGNHHNWHYDICYMSVAADTNFTISEESVDMRWVSMDELRQFVKESKAQQRALEMAENSLALYDALVTLNKLPPIFPRKSADL